MIIVRHKEQPSQKAKHHRNVDEPKGSNCDLDEGFFTIHSTAHLPDKATHHDEDNKSDVEPMEQLKRSAPVHSQLPA